MAEEGEEWDLEVLNKAAFALSGQDPSMSPDQANEILCSFTISNTAYHYVKQIIESDCQYQLQYTAFQALSKTISSRWQVIEIQAKEEIQNFLIEFIFKSPETIQQPLLTIAHECLIALLFHVYPQNWPNFINESLDFVSENSFQLSRCLDFFTAFFTSVADGMTKTETANKCNRMQNAIMRNKHRIFMLLQMILTSSDSEPPLIKSALSTLAISVKWWYPFEIFNSDIFSTLTEHFLNIPEFAIDTFSVFSEIAQNITFPDSEGHSIVILFTLLMNAYTSLNEPQILSTLNEQQIVKLRIDFITALTTYFEHYGYLINNPVNHEQFAQALEYAWSITESARQNLFDLCCEFWFPICTGMNLQYLLDETNAFYAPLLRRFFITRMVKPFDIVTKQDIFGNDIKMFLSDVDLDNEYGTMRKCLAILTKLDPSDTQEALGERFAQLTSEAFDPESFSSLCWAVAATAGTFPKEIEEEIIPEFITQLFSRSNETDDPEEAETLAIGVSYICSEYWDLLGRDTDFFKSCVSQLITYLLQYQQQETIQFVVLNTLNDIAKKRPLRQLFLVASESSNPLIEDILSSLSEIFGSLSKEGIITFITLLCTLILAYKIEERTPKVNSIIQLIDSAWTSEIESLDPPNQEQCNSLISYLCYFTRIPVEYPDIFSIYIQNSLQNFAQVFTTYSEAAAQFASSGDDYQTLQCIKSVKGAIIELFHKFISYIQPSDILPMLTQEFLQLLYQDFSSSPPDARVPQTISFFSTLITRLGKNIEDQLGNILQNIYVPCHDMIHDDLDSYPEMRPEIIQLVHSIITNCSFYLDSLNKEQLEEMVDFVELGCKHPQPEISTSSFAVLHELSNALSTSSNQEVVNIFNESIYPQVFEFCFYMLSDITYRFALKEMGGLIYFLINLPLFSVHIEAISEQVCQFFEDQDPSVITSLFSSLLMQNGCSHLESALSNLKRFLVTVKEVSPFDPQLKRVEADAKLKRIKEQIENVPGFQSQKEKEREMDESTMDFLSRFKNLSIK